MNLDFEGPGFITLLFIDGIEEMQSPDEEYSCTINWSVPELGEPTSVQL